MATSDPGSGEVFDVARIRQLVALMKEHDLSEIHLREGGQQIRLRRGGLATAMPMLAAMPPTAAVAPPPQTSQVAAAAQAAAPAAEDERHFTLIRSPMVGTFYSRPKPDSEPFVKIGDHISAETTVCVIEAMKMFTPIQAEVSGKIVAVLVGNEEPVDFNKPLFKVDTRK